MADDLERPAEPAHEESEQHLPAPSILPFAFAGGVALILIGLSQFWLQAIYGVVILVAVSADAFILRRLQRIASLNRSR